jgi:hypothetical protein
MEGLSETGYKNYVCFLSNEENNKVYEREGARCTHLQLQEDTLGEHTILMN